MNNRWKATVPFLGVLFLAVPQAHGQTELPRSVTGTGAVYATDGTHQIQATLGQAAIGLLAGSTGNASQGFWYALPRAAATTGSLEEPALGSGLMRLDAFPNPFSGSTQLSLRTPYNGQVSVMLYNLLGQPVRTLYDAERPAGEFNLTLIADELPSGRYSVMLKTPGETETISILVVK